MTLDLLTFLLEGDPPLSSEARAPPQRLRSETRRVA